MSGCRSSLLLSLKAPANFKQSIRDNLRDTLDEDEDEDLYYDEFPEEIVLYHYLANIYGWSWHTFWYETPIAVLKIMPKYLNKLWGRGYLGHAEVMHLKAIARSKGYKGFEDYGTGKILRDDSDDDVEDLDDELGLEEEDYEEEKPKRTDDWDEFKGGKPADEYQME